MSKIEPETISGENAFTANPLKKVSASSSTQWKNSQSLWGYIRSDLDRYRITDKRSYLTLLIMCPGAPATIVFRIGHWIWAYKGRFSRVVHLGYPLYILMKRFSEIINGISLQPQATIGKGLYVGHGGSVHIGGKAVLGDNCNISQEVTIGVAGRGEKRGTPKIGDRVYIGAGAKILGKIEIGNDVAIGANAVVTKSLPNRAVAVGIPAHVVSYEGSFEFVIYENMENDTSRQESLRLREQGADTPLIG